MRNVARIQQSWIRGFRMSALRLLDSTAIVCYKYFKLAINEVKIRIRR